MDVPFCELRRQIDSMSEEILAAVTSVLQSGHFILGPKVVEFEERFAAYVHAAHAAGVASGTDALFLIMKALGIGPGDEVIVPVLTAPPTAVAVKMTGAVPIFADVEPEHLLLDGRTFADLITARTRAVIPVHLYGCPADMDQIMAAAQAKGIAVIEDCAQAHGTMWKGKHAGTFGIASAFSFYPTKNLGALGDAGLVLTDDPALADKIRILRDYGRTAPHTVSGPGINSRLDELQAAILLAKLRHLDAWNSKRRRNAARYCEIFAGTGIKCPSEPERGFHTYHQFVIRVTNREGLREFLAGRGIQTAIHYPLLLCDQPGLKMTGDFPRARAAVPEILSLPVFPELTDIEITAVAESIVEFYLKKGQGR